MFALSDSASDPEIVDAPNALSGACSTFDVGEELLWQPDRLVPPDPWVGHIPVAFWLAKLVRPAVFVELGTHSGNSYTAFCQAMDRLALPTRAFAVDTWQGDEHSGLYSDEVFEDLYRFNNSRYTRFSTLLRTTFDNARGDFGDGSIDLLHIDGMHSYEMVRHDFETWLNALSARGVVVFHDTNVRERGFGVWRLWQELAVEYPSFEFFHSNGLGILGIGSEQPPVLRRLFSADRHSKAVDAVRRLFAARGETFRLRVATFDELARIDALTTEQQRLVEELTQVNAAAKEQEDATRIRVEEKSAEVARLAAALANRDREASRHAANLAARERDAAVVLRQARLEVRATREQVARQFRASTSWRVTAPMRAFARLLYRFAAAVPGQGATPFRASVRETLRTSKRLLMRSRFAPPPGDTQASAAITKAKAKRRAELAARLDTFLAGSDRLRLPTSTRPDISILLVLYNNAELTFGCLTSIAECLGADEPRIEVIILDNHSGDATGALLARIDGALLIHSTENLHFLRGVNRAAQKASGRLLLLLNNDAQLMPGSVEAALATWESSSSIGAVGGRIVLPDGTLQEAGSIVWNDGTCTGYARGREPDAPDAMFRRDVDYCSGAFLLTSRSLFNRLGGFDERYAPAYYEETDYCLRLRQAGLRVVYDPDAVILHYEFGSAATNADATDLQRRNHATFRNRHQDWLADQLPYGPENLLTARRAATVMGPATKRVLMIEDRVPHPKLGSGYPRANDLLRALAENAEVTLFPMFRTVETWPEVRRSVPRDVEVMLGQAADGLAAFLDERRGSFEAIVVCRPHNMRAFLDAGGGDPAITGGARIIYDAEAVFAPREVQVQAYAGKPMPPAEIESRLAEEIALARQADTVVAVSPAEARLFEAHGIADVRLLGHALRVDPTTEDFATRDGILFVGAMHDETSPNSDSLRWFAAEVLPILRNKLGIPDLRLKVVGFNRVASIAALDGTALDLVGMVDDLRPHFAAARLVVAPTRIAAGLPHKIGHAAALGVPVVVTALLAEQLGWLPGRDLLSAADAESFAEACGTLYQDQALWERVRDAALQRCGEDYAPARFAATVADLVNAVAARAAPPARAVRPLPPDYADWIRAYDTLSRADRAAIRAHIASFTLRPLISVVVPLYNTPEMWLRRCIDSVRDQLYGNWELCLADDASPQPHVAVICRQYAAMDSRIRFVSRTTRGHIAAASNTALEVASGEFVALLDHDDELADHALYMVAAALEQDPALDLVFSDEDKIDELGTRREPWFKPGWDPDLMRSQNAVVHLAVYRRNLLREIGGFRAGFDGSQDYDLTLRFAERTDPKRIRRLPFVLYHWRAIPGSVALATDQKDYPYQAAARAIQEHLDRIGSGAQVTREAHQGYYRVHWPLPDQPQRVTIIIPTRDRVKLLRTAVESILAKTTYPDFEILVIDNGSGEPASLRYLRDLNQRPRVRVLRDDQPYSFADLNNRAVAQTDAPLLAFVNNDVEVINPDWLAEMVAHALRPDVGAVGAKLYYPNDTVQHAGIVVGIGGLAGHPHVGLARGEPGYFGRAAVAQRFAAVTAACMVMRREVFMELGGFDEDAFAVAFNDVDLGLRLNAAGYAVVWTPYAELVHHESASLGLPNSDERREQFDRECDNLIARWDSVITDDPFYNPNLTITGGDYAPAFPPRARKPWQDYFAVKDRSSCCAECRKEANWLK